MLLVLPFVSSGGVVEAMPIPARMKSIPGSPGQCSGKSPSTTKREVPEPLKAMAPAAVESADRMAESSAVSTGPPPSSESHIERVKRLLEQNRRILGSSASNLNRVASSEPPGDDNDADQLIQNATAAPITRTERAAASEAQRPGDAAETASAAAALGPLPQQPDLLPIQVPDAGFNAAALAIAPSANQRRRTPPTSPSAQSNGSKYSPRPIFLGPQQESERQRQRRGEELPQRDGQPDGSQGERITAMARRSSPGRHRSGGKWGVTIGVSSDALTDECPSSPLAVTLDVSEGHDKYRVQNTDEAEGWIGSREREEWLKALQARGRGDGPPRRFLTYCAESSALGAQYSEKLVQNLKGKLGFSVLGTHVEDMNPWGPAHLSEMLDVGDEILEVDGAATTMDNIAMLMLGNGAPETVVHLTVQRAKGGGVEKVSIPRMFSPLVSVSDDLFATLHSVLSKIQAAHKIVSSGEGGARGSTYLPATSVESLGIRSGGRGNEVLEETLNAAIRHLDMVVALATAVHIGNFDERKHYLSQRITPVEVAYIKRLHQQMDHLESFRQNPVKIQLEQVKTQLEQRWMGQAVEREREREDLQAVACET